MPHFIAHNIWSTPIYENEISVKDEWIEFCNNINYKRTFNNNGSISVGPHLLENISLLELKEKILYHVDVYTNHQLNISNKFRMCSSWCIKHIKGDFAQVHSHKNSIISGVYYLQVTDGCGDIFFKRDKFLSESFLFDLKKSTIMNSIEYKISVKTGKLILFPSTLEHYTDIMPLDNFERIAISFNMFLDGPIGEEDRFLHA